MRIFRSLLTGAFLLLGTGLFAGPRVPFDKPIAQEHHSRLLEALDPEWLESLLLGLSYNTQDGSSMPLELWPVYHIDIPVKGNEDTVSHLIAAHADPVFIKRFVTTKAGIQYFRIFFLNSKRMDLETSRVYEKLVHDFGPASMSHVGVWIPSKMTYFVWNVFDHGQAPMELKFRGIFSLPGRSGIVNSPENNHASILVTSLVHSLTHVKRARTFSWLNESISLGVFFPNDEYGFLARDLETGDKEVSWYLHAFLDSPLVDECAAQMGLLRDEWIRTEYLPKLAQFWIESQFNFGIYFAAHTQNLLIQVDLLTGRIRKFRPKDGADVQFDEFFIAQNFPILPSLRDHSLEAAIPLINHPNIWNGDSDLATHPIYYLFLYAFRSVQLEVSSFEEQTRMFHEFVETYLRQLAEKYPRERERFNLIYDEESKAEFTRLERDARAIDEREFKMNAGPLLKANSVAMKAREDLHQATKELFLKIFTNAYKAVVYSFARKVFEDPEAKRFRFENVQIPKNFQDILYKENILFTSRTVLFLMGGEAHMVNPLRSLKTHPGGFSVYTLRGAIYIFDQYQNLLGWAPDQSKFDEVFKPTYGPPHACGNL